MHTSPKSLRIATLLLLAGACLDAAATAAPDEVLLEHGQITAADGSTLEHSVLRPDREEPVPALLVRTAYGRLLSLPAVRGLAERGIAVMVQDCAGTGASGGGPFVPFVRETTDGRAAWDWLHAQPWCDGRVGTIGMSYLGITQWRLMADPEVSLDAMLLQFTSGDLYRDLIHFGGAQSLGIGLSWALRVSGRFGTERYDHLPIVEADDASGLDVSFWNDWCRHESLDDYWRAMDLRERRAQMEAPALLIAGWYDLFLPGQVKDYVALSQREGSPETSFARLIIGPWDHAGSTATAGRPDLGPAAYLSTADEERAFLDRFLLDVDNGYEQKAGVRAFFLGENRWHELDAWPPRRAERRDFYLHSLGHAADEDSDGVLTGRPPRREETPDAFTYDPREPTPSFAEDLWAPMTALRRQERVGARADVLCYTTLPLRAPLRIAGPMSLEAWLSTDVPDTDLAACLVSIEPDGRAHWRGEGILRARYREGFERPLPLPADEPVRLEVDLGPMACVIPAGHRLGIQVSSSNFPRFSRNLGTGQPHASESEMRVAHHRLHHEPQRASRLRLWVLPED